MIEQLKSIQDENTDDETKKNEYDQANLDFFRPLLIELRQKGLIAGIHIMASDYLVSSQNFVNFAKKYNKKRVYSFGNGIKCIFSLLLGEI